MNSRSWKIPGQQESHRLMTLQATDNPVMTQEGRADLMLRRISLCSILFLLSSLSLVLVEEDGLLQVNVKSQKCGTIIPRFHLYLREVCRINHCEFMISNIFPLV